MMKRVRFADAGFFVFRVPLLPVAAFQQSQRPFDSTPPSPAEAPAESWPAPLNRSELANAIALQSPSLWNAIGRARHTIVGRTDSRAALALYRYTARAALRCTPRGPLPRPASDGLRSQLTCSSAARQAPVFAWSRRWTT